MSKLHEELSAEMDKSERIVNAIIGVLFFTTMLMAAMILAFVLWLFKF
jgi:hypothetical protein